MQRIPITLLTLTALTLAACGRGTDGDGGSINVTIDTVPAATAQSSPTVEAPGPGESHTITTSNGAVSMGLAGDRVVVRLSDATLEQVRREMNDDGDRRDTASLGGRIEGMVKSAVEGALSKHVEYPLAEIEDVRYDGGAIRFTFRGSDRRMIEQTKVDDRPLLESFAPNDARRFVDAVRAAKARTTAQ